MATHLYSACQALDLRYIEFVAFRDMFRPSVLTSLTKHFAAFLSGTQLASLASKVEGAIWRRLESTGSVDLIPRWEDAFAHTSSLVLDALASSRSEKNPLTAIAQWRKESADAACAMMRQVRNAFFSAATSPTTALLGKGTKRLYVFVREVLGVKARRGDVFLGRQEQKIGTGVSKIYESIKNGAINGVLTEMMG